MLHRVLLASGTTEEQKALNKFGANLSVDLTVGWLQNLGVRPAIKNHSCCCLLARHQQESPSQYS
jgi:hypothetical protein